MGVIAVKAVIETNDQVCIQYTNRGDNITSRLFKWITDISLLKSPANIQINFNNLLESYIGLIKNKNKTKTIIQVVLILIIYFDIN